MVAGRSPSIKGAQLKMLSIENSCLRSTELWNMLNHLFSQKHESDVCQYVTDDCTIRYEFVHKQIMRPTTPQNSEEWKSLGPQYFCNSWPGNGRSEWVSEGVSIWERSRWFRLQDFRLIAIANRLPGRKSCNCSAKLLSPQPTAAFSYSLAKPEAFLR